jgi:hypothetical protein
VSRTIWTLGAVMREDGPHAEVREGRADDAPDYRVMAWHGFDAGERRRFEGCSRKACKVGAACENHELRAAHWWYEWQRRADRQARRDALAVTVEHDGSAYTFTPSLPDDDPSPYWGSITRRSAADGRWLGAGVYTLDAARERWRSVTDGAELPAILATPAGPGGAE